MGNVASRPHILLVDDSPEILDLMTEILTDEGYRVSTSLVPLLPADVAAVAPDLIIQELLYGGKWEAGWSDLVSDPARIPRILCTAASERVREPAMVADLDRLGIQVLLKPFLLEELLAVVASALTAQRVPGRAQRSQQEAPAPAGALPWDGSSLYATSPG